MKEPRQDEETPLSFLEVMATVLATAFGVQTRERRIRDFKRGRGLHFFIAGVIYMLCLLTAMVFLVRYLTS